MYLYHVITIQVDAEMATLREAVAKAGPSSLEWARLGLVRTPLYYIYKLLLPCFHMTFFLTTLGLRTPIAALVVLAQ